MLKFDIPGFGELNLAHVVFDYNGTLAVNGYLLEGIKERLNLLSERITVHVITGDSYGHAKNELADVNCKITILAAENQAIAKKNYLSELDPSTTVAVGNGRNDQKMLKDAALGIVVIGDEGLAVESMLAADLIFPDIFSVFETLLHVRRIVATLRS